MKQSTLRPSDVAVALELSLEEDQPYPKLAQAVGVSLGEAHNAVQRLVRAKLVSAVGRRTVRPALLEFIVSGVPYAFPAEIGPETRGVPTGIAAALPAQDFSSVQPLVWPSSEGSQRGPSVTPLYPAAKALPQRNPALYELLALVDGVRAGQARERAHAKELLAERILGHRST